MMFFCLSRYLKNGPITLKSEQDYSLSLIGNPEDLTQEDKDKLYADYLALCKRVRIAEVERYDKSEQVNGFYLAGQHCWLDKATRVGLANSIAIEKAAGKTETTLYLNGVALTIGIEQAQQMLAALELYALDCYRKTEEHKATINALNTIEEVENYDCTQGYPEQLHLEV